MAIKRVAKLLVIDGNNKHLLMYRSSHPTFGNDPDLPGGTWEEGESLLETMIREVKEEIGLVVDVQRVEEIYFGNAYSRHGTHYSFFLVRVDQRPKIIMSWEHSTYEWLDLDVFLEKANNAKDTYMHMVYNTIRKHR